MRSADGPPEVPLEVTTGQDSDVDEADLRDLLDDVRSGVVDPDDAVAVLRRLPFADLGFARVDHHRALRSGLARGGLRAGQDPRAVRRDRRRAARRRRPSRAAHPRRRRPDRRGARRPPGRSARGHHDRVEPAPRRPARARARDHRRHRRPARRRRVRRDPRGPRPRAQRITDVGVAGVHRLLVHADELAGPTSSWSSPAWRARWRASSVASRPRRSSPCRRASATAPASRASPRCSRCSSSCAAGVTVVGIDNGFGAACAALRLCTVHDRSRATFT